MPHLIRNRWVQLVLGIVCMIMIANLQYGWTLFVLPIDQAHKWGTKAIQIAFTIFVVTETWLVPFEGYLIDRFGPRPTVFAGGLLIGASWLINGYADSLTMLYIGAAVGGTGGGIIYGATIGNAAKWFPDRRGLASGLTAAGFGAGSAITIVPISLWIAANGYQMLYLTSRAIGQTDATKEYLTNIKQFGGGVDDGLLVRQQRMAGHHLELRQVGIDNR